METFLKRSLTGLIFGFVYLLLAFINYFTLGFLLLSIATLCLYEFYCLKYKVEFPRYIWLIPAVIFFIFYFIIAHFNFESKYFLLFLAIVPLIFIYELFSENNKLLRNMSIGVLGYIYILLPCILWLNIIYSPFSKNHYQIFIGFTLILWANDVGAYLLGVWKGKHKMMPKISPKKSWEGFFGGVLLSLMTSYIIYLFFDSLTLFDWINISIIVSIFGNIGDFIASAMKRTCNRKDSGILLPGHGGFLDRFDSFLFASIFVFIYLSIKYF